MGVYANFAKPFNFFALLIILATCQICDGYLDRGYVLYNGLKGLSKGQYLKNGPYELKLTGDCRLVLYDASAVVWQNRRNGWDERCSCGFEEDGNIRIYSEHVYWSIFKFGAHEWGQYVLVLQKDRDVAIYGPALWSSGTRTPWDPDAYIDSNQNYVLYSSITGANKLQSGESLKNGLYALKMQDDCNLVLYDNNEESIWSTNTAGLSTGCYCKLQKSDANLVVYDDKDNPLWSTDITNTRKADENGVYVLVLQSNRNLVIYDTPIWHTNTRTPDFPHNVMINTTTTETFTETNFIATVV